MVFEYNLEFRFDACGLYYFAIEINDQDDKITYGKGLDEYQDYIGTFNDINFYSFNIPRIRSWDNKLYLKGRSLENKDYSFLSQREIAKYVKALREFKLACDNDTLVIGG